MKNFIVLFKPITVPMQFDSNSIHIDTVQLDYLLQEYSKKHQNYSYSDYTIDEKTISFQTIGGKLCVVVLAFRK